MWTNHHIFSRYPLYDLHSTFSMQLFYFLLIATRPQPLLWTDLMSQKGVGSRNQCRQTPGVENLPTKSKTEESKRTERDLQVWTWTGTGCGHKMGQTDKGKRGPRLQDCAHKLCIYICYISMGEEGYCDFGLTYMDVPSGENVKIAWNLSTYI